MTPNMKTLYLICLFVSGKLTPAPYNRLFSVCRRLELPLSSAEEGRSPITTFTKKKATVTERERVLKKRGGKRKERAAR